MNVFALSICLFTGSLTHYVQEADVQEFKLVSGQLGIEIRLPVLHSSEPNNHLRYRIYRASQPHFEANARSLKYESSAKDGLIFLDPIKGLRPGEVYYYKVEEISASGSPIALTPAGLSPLQSKTALSSAATAQFSPLDVVFIGDSITEGGWLRAPDQNACQTCAHALELGSKPRTVLFSNQGHSGHTTKDYLPGGDDFRNAEAAAHQLIHDAPGQLVFSVMLGTNDSANIGPNGSPVSAAQYDQNLKATLRKLLADFPGSKIVVQKPIWYSSNTHNSSTYEEEGLQRLTSYFPIVERLPKQFPKGKVFLGDTRGFDYFSTTYMSTLRIENGRDGTFYLHPNGDGSRDLGCLWATAILRAVD